MTTYDYPLMLQYGPGPLQAFLSAPDVDALAECAVALANTDGGAILIGLTQRGAYTGPPDGTAVARALAEAARVCTPALVLHQVELVATPGGPAVAVRVPRSDQVHALADGRVLVRENGRNRALSGDEIRTMISARTVGDFDNALVPGVTPRELDPDLVANFMVQRAERSAHAAAGSAELPLEALGAVTPEGQVTVAGLLLFGRDPQQWLPDTGVRFVRLLGTPTLAVGAPHIVFERDLRGALVPLLDQMWDTIQSQVRVPSDASEPPDYPVVALREALVNAVVHRDYRLRSAPITIRMYNDQIAITSPGGLPGYMTSAQHLLQGRYSRNPRLSWALFEWGYITAPGQGMLRMVTDMDRHGHRPPEIEAGHQAVTVRLYSARQAPVQEPVASETLAAHLNARQVAALAHVQEHGSLTLLQFRTLCPDASSVVLQRDLSELVAWEHLRKIGPRNGAYYIQP